MKSPNKTFLKVLLVSTIFFGIAGMAGYALADTIGQYIPLAPLPGITPTQANNIPAYLKYMFKLFIGVAAALAVVRITIGGIQYMSTDSMSGKSEGKDTIQQALLGLLLAMGAWLILNTVNPRTLDFNFNPPAIPKLNPSATTTAAILGPSIYKVSDCLVTARTATSSEFRRVRILNTFVAREYDDSELKAAQACMTSWPIPGIQPEPEAAGCLTLEYSCTPTRPAQR